MRVEVKWREDKGVGQFLFPSAFPRPAISNLITMGQSLAVANMLRVLKPSTPEELLRELNNLGVTLQYTDQ